jgi:hypothetical protein
MTGPGIETRISFYSMDSIIRYSGIPRFGFAFRTSEFLTDVFSDQWPSLPLAEIWYVSAVTHQTPTHLGHR